MKKIGIIGIGLCLGMLGCKKEGTVHVVGSIDGMEDGKKVFVKIASAAGLPVTKDTLQIKGGAFVYETTMKIPQIYYFFPENLRGAIPVIMEPGTITVTAYKDSLNASLVKGTASNDELQILMGAFKAIGKKIGALQNQLFKANQEKDTATVKKLQQTYLSYEKEGLDYQLKFIKEHPKSYISALIVKQLLLSNKIEIQVAREAYNAFPPVVKASAEGKDIEKKLQELASTTIGGVAPDFSAPTPSGGTLALKDYRGKVTIVDFWAAWCAPCRAENPKMVQLYNKYRDKGLHIIGVSLDKKAEDWKKAIADDQLSWEHVSNLKFWQDPIAKAYQVRSIPATFLLDKEGRIVAKNATGEELEAKVAELLQK